ncbi:3-isopropylmalate dehydrogenase [Allomyces macrogynus ATCC 38327]|uniref:3-isopropylmalate dehydrogenase n=1 Tax=Allomyces macrogynus (strain ATCC 38327) TaxID=578462 RepID=A0A0L0T9B5_ALLM3|nr:3-isopropylmalate dehydrogenase [Allomyces macrogynus ATCC 38327]|eukprot:KNE71305.1 3-isopropylmalate dehydrogenase [Allomyces macrogynus ATCC 38327]
MSSSSKVVLLPGDGIGPEIVAQAARILALFPHISTTTHLVGGAAIDATGSPFPDTTRDAVSSADAILLGAVGGPKWEAQAVRPEQGLLAMRKHLDLFANIRPVFFPAEKCRALSPLKPETLAGFDKSIVVRELVSGIYFGARTEANYSVSEVEAHDQMTYKQSEIARITHLAAHLALASSPPEPVTLVDKANVLATSRLWRKTVTDIMAQSYPQIPFSTCLVDAAAMHMIKDPKKLNGIVLTENLFGDILSDEASVIPGSLGLMPSASLAGLEKGKPGLYEPIHGSAPDIAGQGKANPIGTILSVAMMFRYSLNMPWEAELIEEAVRAAIDAGTVTADLGGSATTAAVGDLIVTLVEAALKTRRRPMTICEKILTDAAIGLQAPGNVTPGDMICVKVDWTLASELTWKGMEKTFDQMGRPKIHDPKRFWLAIDHTVDPKIMHQAKPQALIAASERFAKEAGLTDFHGPNQTILHTEFCRQRAQPGQVIIGADSHSCSAGNVGAFAVGLGAADVTMPLCTGETWLRVPEVVEIKFVGRPRFGIGGKDTILYVLGELKRNTVAFERAVEYTGPGLRHMSCDARFAIANMTTEFGGIAGVFEADEVTAAYIAQRKDHNQGAKYFRADKHARYAESHTIDLGKVDSLVALYPSPDNVVPVSQVAGKKLDGCFIGACTTAEEDLILAALVLRAGLKRGLTPAIGGKRKVTPGSVPILHKLRKLGLAEVYERAGFEIGAPGCSYCLGIAADVAGEGEVWLSSQNRNFANRMGKGSIGNLASAATVAASSFDMKITDPRVLLDGVDENEFREMCKSLDIDNPTYAPSVAPITIREPKPELLCAAHAPAAKAAPKPAAAGAAPAATGNDSDSDDSGIDASDAPKPLTTVIRGKAQVFGDNIDTDAIIPAPFMPGKDDHDLGTHCFEYWRPEFRDKVTQGFTIVVAGEGFGSGSSREEAPRALKGAGVQAVIAKGYAFIYGRNQYNMALLGVIVKDDKFYELAQEGSEIEVDVPARRVRIAGHEFPFALSDFEERLVSGGGVTDMYRKYGKKLFRVNIAATKAAKKAESSACATSGKAADACGTTTGLAW